MTIDDMIAALADGEQVPAEAMEHALAKWDDVVASFRAMLHGYVAGSDLFERTELALFPIVHLLAEKADTASFPDLCRLGESSDKLESVLGPDGAVLSYASILVSTFGGDPAPLEHMIELSTADQYARGDGLLALAFLAGQDRVPESRIYDYLAGLPTRLDKDDSADLWYGYARAVATLGFTGLSAAVEAAFDRGVIFELDYAKADFWLDVRHSQSQGRDFSDPDWQRFEPFGCAVEQLTHLADGPGAHDSQPSLGYAVEEPYRNPMRNVGRNDSCPCGSGRKFKKCCLQAGVA